MKRVVTGLICVVLVGIGLVFSSNSKITKEKDQQITKVITKSNMNDFFKNPRKYVGYEIEHTGIVDQSEYVKGKGVYSTILVYPEQYSGAIMLVDQHAQQKLQQQKTIKFTGYVTSAQKKENKFGGIEITPRVTVNEIELVEGRPREAKQLKVVKINESKKSSQYYSRIDSVSYLTNSARISLFLYNKTNERMYFNDNSIELLADDMIIPTKYEILEKSERLSRSIEANTGSHGILTFNKIPLTTKELQLTFKLNGTNTTKDFKVTYRIRLND